MSVNDQSQVAIDKKPVLTWGEWMKTPTGMITIVVIVLVIVGGGWYWYSQKDKSLGEGSIDSVSPELPSSGRSGSNITVAKMRGGYY